jgi:hypothetical protein
MVKINKLTRVRDKIAKSIHLLEGKFIIPKNSYEGGICNAIGWELFDSRYFDAYCTGSDTFIELKKGQGSMHFDMIRYSEIVLGFGKQNTVTVFLKWNKKRSIVSEAYVIDTANIITFLKLDKAFAKQCLRIHRRAVRGVNMLAAATVNDLRGMASFIIKNQEKPRNTFIKLNIQ